MSEVGRSPHCTDPVSKTRYPRNLPPSRLGAFSSPFALSASYLDITINLADLKDKLFLGYFGAIDNREGSRSRALIGARFENKE